jgi:hypothetical protein
MVVWLLRAAWTLKRRTIQGDVISIGDRVQISCAGRNRVIELIEPADRIGSYGSHTRGEFRQILLAILINCACLLHLS